MQNISEIHVEIIPLMYTLAFLPNGYCPVPMRMFTKPSHSTLNLSNWRNSGPNVSRFCIREYASQIPARAPVILAFLVFSSTPPVKYLDSTLKHISTALVPVQLITCHYIDAKYSLVLIQRHSLTCHQSETGSSQRMLPSSEIYRRAVQARKSSEPMRACAFPPPPPTLQTL